MLIVFGLVVIEFYYFCTVNVFLKKNKNYKVTVLFNISFRGVQKYTKIVISVSYNFNDLCYFKFLVFFFIPH